MRPEISVLIPAHNEGPRLVETIRSISRARSTDARLEFVIADDQSTDDPEGHLRAAWPVLREEPGVEVKVRRLSERAGVPCARNHAASYATADILFHTDAHVRFREGWDRAVFGAIEADRILAGAIADPNSSFVGYGCRLVVPFMGTHWNQQHPEGFTDVEVASCAATALPRELFERLHGYDTGMLRYGAAEPEFSVRAWLYGAQILMLPQIVVEHRFKPPDERAAFLRSVREYMVHNGLRFGLLYSSELGALQLLRYYARKFPNLFASSIKRVSESDLWRRRAQIDHEQSRPFSWFVDHFRLKDHQGGEIP